MPSWIADLVRLDGDGEVFRTTATFGAGNRLFGGLIAAQALAAAGATVDPARLPQSLHAYFIKGGRVGVDVEYVVECTRDGKSFNTRRVTASQDGVPIFEMLASFHRSEPTTDWQRADRPAFAWSGATKATGLPEQWADHFEVRSGPAGMDDWPLQPMWFRSREPIEDDPLLRACALTFISDVGLVATARPPGGSPGPGPGGAASLDHAVWFHRPIDLGGWHLYDAEAVSHSDARGLARGSIVAQDGTLVASVAQESLWRI
ncbi:acyl-CoA thioesterase II [Mycolicibacterium duvalii]|uniref:Acyl-CoA thioesterase II n=1 Tax=Mycolicibacterium duvalii TaxID=39688 RepID=A0A7I7JWZ5_9MYCO|nr:acyl-CoA thioesterase domain-containing protein [Mycolicibacterium duvalii]MCV7369629.1 thioesterase family protein [Mycolicibacterium duvalii]PEG36435.1 acyl-CoA thioesterase II [Mycolicibacterium duvalii]BBX16356.1 acyl-CoA thioesterase II [Mycolicibacterium duvalii]